MLRSGKVVAAENGVLEVCFERPEACAHCGQCGGQKEETFVKIPGSAPVGRWIDVDMPEGQVLKASMLAYVMPLLMLLVLLLACAIAYLVIGADEVSRISGELPGVWEKFISVFEKQGGAV